MLFLAPTDTLEIGRGYAAGTPVYEFLIPGLDWFLFVGIFPISSATDYKATIVQWARGY